ncbi:TetR/AcrR family transcriptional regulator [Mycobacterium talmoniae]|uniref:TetR family transcriptional regulator n=1 Tax=Mycobacterium talmoniae TaxID=1858794 RepID=A0A1S1N9N5_9MYCO|nr:MULTISPECIES: TetR/AcrR family transcriptional regulator [Mycobacterium]OHU96076.1 TetR family transcriptional regulator [Mycobacterium talmoniae]PQM46353.1 hypothetical protein C1Y40_03473 [Mycobacterium talmoniae]TDH56181.1 TetR/AcrR family transcriptional regulator [Mycobacterium eburneum]
MLDTALDIAGTHGVAEVTMAAIAERMGVTRPVVYACYNGRGEVLAALLEREADVALTSLFGILPPEKTSTVEQMFVDGFRGLLTICRERPAAWRIMYAADPDPVIVAAIARGRAQVGRRMAELMRPLLERREVDDIDRVLTALTEVFLSIGEAAIRMVLDPEQGWTPEELAEIVGRAASRAFRVG